MKRLLFLWMWAALLVPTCGFGQLTDSLGRMCLVPASEGYVRRIDRRSSTRAYRMTFVAVPLIVGGLVMKPFDDDFRRLRNGYARSFAYHYDDYLQYLPMATMFGMKAFGVQSRSSWGRMLVSDAFSAALMATAVNSLKYSCRVMRPDGSTRNTFPSGHTATAFMAATMLHKEYGHLSPWVSVGAYSVATFTGISRQLNNRHWASDVMVGAGIGILATELGYLFADLIYRKRGLNIHETTLVYDRYRHPSFFSYSLGLSVVPGSYTVTPGCSVELMSGPTVGVEGAWFASPYLGVGGRLNSSFLRVSVNGVSQTENFKCASAGCGAYLSYPFSVRWMVGSKLLGGYEGYRNCRTDVCRLGGRGGIPFWHGFFGDLSRFAEFRRAVSPRLRHGAADDLLVVETAPPPHARPCRFGGSLTCGSGSGLCRHAGFVHGVSAKREVRPLAGPLAFLRCGTVGAAPCRIG